MSQTTEPAYTPEQSVLLAMETLRSTNVSDAELLIIEEIEREARDREEQARKGRPPGRHARRRAERAAASRGG